MRHFYSTRLQCKGFNSNSALTVEYVSSMYISISINTINPFNKRQDSMSTMEQQTKLCANPLSKFEYCQERPSNIANIAK